MLPDADLGKNPVERSHDSRDFRAIARWKASPPNRITVMLRTLEGIREIKDADLFYGLTDLRLQHRGDVSAKYRILE
jgi:hypothetical protein